MILNTAPDGAKVLDLSAAHIARAEATVQARVIKISAGYVEVRNEIDVFAADDFFQNRIRDGLAKLLKDPADIDEIVKFGLTSSDLELLTDFVLGKTPGE